MVVVVVVFVVGIVVVSYTCGGSVSGSGIGSSKLYCM